MLSQSVHYWLSVSQSWLPLPVLGTARVSQSSPNNNNSFFPRYQVLQAFGLYADQTTGGTKCPSFLLFSPPVSSLCTLRIWRNCYVRHALTLHCTDPLITIQYDRVRMSGVCHSPCLVVYKSSYIYGELLVKMKLQSHSQPLIARSNWAVTL